MQQVTTSQATPKVAALHRYWHALRSLAAGLPVSDAATPPTETQATGTQATGTQADETLPPPPRHMLDPAAILPLLPNVMLVEFEPQPFRIRYRLTGTLVDDASGCNLTGWYLDDFNKGMTAPIFGPLIENYRRIWQSGQPVIDFYVWTTQNGRTANVCYGLFPLTIDHVITQAIAIEEYDPSRLNDPFVPFQPPR